MSKGFIVDSGNDGALDKTRLSGAALDVLCSIWLWSNDWTRHKPVMYIWCVNAPHYLFKLVVENKVIAYSFI